MIKSMTGFGRCENHQGSRKFTVEMKAVNHRYFDVSIKMPKKLGFFEAAIRGVLLGAVGVYQPLVEFAGAGASVPLTGFGNTLAKGVKEAVQEDGFLGIFTGGLKASAGGITAAILSGLIASLIFKAKDKS